MAELARPGTFRGLVLFEPILFPPDANRPEGAAARWSRGRGGADQCSARRDEAYDELRQQAAARRPGP